jgi:hypothetical protein
LDVAAFPDQQGVRPPAAASPANPGDRPPGAPLLGRLLVERGLLGEEQLAAGLAEQERTGEPLGKVLIRLGFVDSAIVALALASQHGGGLKTEYGFATGFRTHRHGAPMLEPPLTPSPGDTTPVPSEPDLALHTPAAPAAGLSTSWEGPSQPPSRESPPVAVSAEAPEEEQSDESAQVEPEAERRGEVDSVSIESDGTTLARARGSDGVADIASRTDAVEVRRETILDDLQTTGVGGDLGFSAEPPTEIGQAVESAELEWDRLADVAPAPSLPAAPAPWGARESALGGPESASSDCDLAPAEALPATADAHQLQTRIAVLEGELATARLAIETATAESRTALAASEISAARIEQLEHELAAARAGERALRSENDLLHAALEQSATRRDLQERLVGRRLTDIDQRLEAASAQIAALQGRSVSN